MERSRPDDDADVMPASATPPDRTEPRPDLPPGARPSASANGRPRDRIIPDRGEFVDALRALRRGHVLVRIGDDPRGCILDGARLYWSFQTLLQYGLIAEYENRAGLPNVHYYRITGLGRTFAERACDAWRRRPLLERLAVRMSG